jgi:hypothetical protein
MHYSHFLVFLYDEIHRIVYTESAGYQKTQKTAATQIGYHYRLVTLTICKHFIHTQKNPQGQQERKKTTKFTVSRRKSTLPLTGFTDSFQIDIFFLLSLTAKAMTRKWKRRQDSASSHNTYSTGVIGFLLFYFFPPSFLVSLIPFAHDTSWAEIIFGLFFIFYITFFVFLSSKRLKDRKGLGTVL